MKIESIKDLTKIREALESIPTCYLVKELEKRGPVYSEMVEPHQRRRFSVEGPAVILFIYD